MRAIIQGEYHVSGTDRESLKSKLTGGVDALFVEKREDRIGPESWNIGYLIFLIGVMTYYWGQACLYQGEDVLENEDIPVHDEIDTPLPELYQRFPDSWKVYSGAISGAVFLFGLLVSHFPVPIISVPLSLSIAYTLTLKLVFVVGAPLLFSVIMIIFENREIGGREEDMAEAITEESHKNEYQTVVVSCGDAHVESLSELLEERGWETETHSSNHRSWASKIWSK